MSKLSDYPPNWPEVARQVKEDAEWRCARCRHPHEFPGKHVMCRPDCDFHRHPEILLVTETQEEYGYSLNIEYNGPRKQRVLTVHHLDNDKHNLFWWNLTPLCQVCRLIIQTKVVMARPWLMFEHSEWFKPYAAGYYAYAYLHQNLSRQETMARLGELLALERLKVYTIKEKQSD